MILGDLSLPSLRSRQVLRSGLHAGTAASCLRAGVKTAVDGGIVRELCECAQYTIETRRRREAFSINASSVAIKGTVGGLPTFVKTLNLGVKTAK